MKTIFITSFHAHVSRNILATDFLKIIKDIKDLRAVILVPKYKIDYFRKNFGASNILIDGTNLYQSSRHKTGLFFKRLSMMLLDTDTKRYKYRYKVYRDRKRIYFFGAMAVGFFGKSMLVKRFIRFLDFKLSPRGLFNDLINKYNPNLILATDIQNENDVTLMHDAKHNKIPILGMVRSWDNPTQYAIRVFPDKLLVGSRAIAESVVEFQGYPSKKIITVGQLHYDKYLKGPTKNRQEFCKEFGLNPSKRFILFAPLGDKFIENNDLDQYVMELLGKAGYQILVRFPPDEKVSVIGFKKPGNMIFHNPGVVFDSKEFNDREISDEDDSSLINSIYHSDLVITGPTSILLDSSFFDKPVIAVNMAPTERNFFDKVYCYKFSHIQKVFDIGKIKYVETEEDLHQSIMNFFSNPNFNKEGRKKIRDFWFSHTDGFSSNRLVSEIEKMLEAK